MQVYTKKRFIALFIFLSVFLIQIPAFAEGNAEQQKQEQDEIMQQQLDKLDSRQIEEFLNALNRDNQGSLPAINWRETVWKIAKGNYTWNPVEITKQALGLLFKEVTANVHILAKIIILAVICAILQNFQSTFASSSVSQLAYTVCYLLLVTIALGGFFIAVDLGRNVVEQMVQFMQALLPLLLTLLTTMGNFATAAVFSPVILVSVEFMGTLVQNFVIPLIFFTAILAVVDNISDRVSVSRLTGFLKEISVISMGVILCLFIGVMVVRGVTASVTDGVSLRTVKYLTGAFVPILGGMFADALDIVVGCSLILKNAIGIVGILILLFIVSIPLLKMVALLLIYRFSAVIIQPLGEKRLVETMNSMGNSLALLFVSVVSVGFMFVVAVTIIIGAANVTVMMR